MSQLLLLEPEIETESSPQVIKRYRTTGGKIPLPAGVMHCGLCDILMGGKHLAQRSKMTYFCTLCEKDVRKRMVRKHIPLFETALAEILALNLEDGEQEAEAEEQPLVTLYIVQPQPAESEY
jgi:hypothetical protein